MARASYRSSDVDLMARMMRAEAEGEGKQGMLYVGNVIVNRLTANCLDFRNLRTIPQVIYQVQGGELFFRSCAKRKCFLSKSKRSGKKTSKTKLRILATTPW